MIKKLSYKDYNKQITTHNNGNVQSYHKEQSKSNNTFLVHFEKNWLQNCPSDFKPYYYWRYDDDNFVLFTSPQLLKTSENFLNDQNANVSFSFESEKQNRMSFLDAQINREDKIFISKCFKKVMDNIHVVKQTILTVDKKPLVLVPPYLSSISLKTRTKLKKPLNNLNKTKLNKTRLGNNFHFKDRIPNDLISGVVYIFQCGLCSEFYYGECVRHLNVRIGEYIGISPLTKKQVKPKNNSVADHLLFCNHSASYDNA